MAYASSHSGPEIDAAVEMLAQVQDARDSTKDDREKVENFAVQVSDDAGQVSSQAAMVSDKAGQVLVLAAAVEGAHAEVLAAADSAGDARSAAQLAAGSAAASQGAAAASERAAAQSQLAAGLSEQVAADSAGVAADTRDQVLLVAQAVEADTQAAQASAESAMRSAQNAAEVVTGGTASFDPAPGKIPLASGQGKIDSGWIDIDIARAGSVAIVAAAVAELAVEDDPSKGAAVVAWDGEKVSRQLDLSKKLHDYTDLRAYQGTATRVEITKAGIAGAFELDLADQVNPDNGGTVIVGAGGRRWKRQFTGLSDVAWFNELADANASAAVQKSISEAQARGATTIEVNSELDCPDALTGRSRVMMRGEGRLKGDGAYRKQVFTWNAQSAALHFNDLDPSKHLQRFSAAKSPRVVLVGSSTGAWSPNSIDTSSTVARLLADRIARYNPDKSVKFFNRCIGGQSYDHLDTVPTGFPTWYTDHAKPWLNYVEELTPDVVFIIMGSGDSSNMSYSRLKSVTDKIKAFARVPDIVYITQPSVNPDPHANFASFGTKTAQEGRDYSAGLIRSFAMFNRYGMIDANRSGGIVLDGRDLCDTVSERVYGFRGLSNGDYTSDLKAHDFSLRVNFIGNQEAIDAAFANISNPVFVRTGPGNKGDVRGGDIMYIKKSSSGYFRFEFFTKGDLTEANYTSITTDVPFPTGSFSLDVFKAGCTIGVSVADSEDSAFMMFPIISHGGEFSPQIGYRNGGGPFASLAYLNIGRPRQYLPALTSQQAWGERSADASTQMPYGGNGVNHFSSLGTTFIYGPLLNRQVLTASRTADGTYTPVVGDMFNVAAVVPGAAMWSRQGDTVSVSGAVSITPAASGLTQVDLSLPILSNLLAPSDLAGTCGAGMVSGMAGSVWGNDVTDRARVQFTTAVTTAQNVRYTFSYRIK